MRKEPEKPEEKAGASEPAGEGPREPLSRAGFQGLEQHVRSIARTQEAIREAFARLVVPSTAWLDQIRAQIEANRKSIIEPALRMAALYSGHHARGTACQLAGNE